MIVVDCSAVVDALTGAGDTAGLHRTMAAEDLHAPALIDVEIVSALRGLVRRGQLGPGRADDALTDFDDLTLRRWACVDAFRRRAFALRDHMTAYDAAYVVLAESLGCRLLTRDERLMRTVGHQARIELV